MADYVGLETSGHVLLEDGSGLLLEVQSRDVIIPDPGGAPLLCGNTVLVGQHLVGETSSADTYQDFTLDLPQGTAEVLTSAPVNVTVSVDVTGYLDLLIEAPNVLNQRDVTVTVTADFVLQLDADSAVTSTGVTVTANTGDLLLPAGSAEVYLDFVLIITPDETLPLELDGGVVHVNPVLMPFDCTDLDMVALTCEDLDLLLPVATEIDLVVLDCLEA